MSDAPVEIDLKFLPDWLKESPATNRYADYQGDGGERPRREGGGGGRSGGAPGRESRGPRRDGPPPRGREDRRGPRPGGAPHGDRRGNDRPPRFGDRRREPERMEREARPAPVPTAEVRIEFLPEPHGLTGIARQIKSGTRAYPLFGTARLFLERPERHRVRITSQDPAVLLHQCAEGPVSFDRAAVERNAFRQLREDYYKEQVVEGEPLKGNFSNVARCRSTGALLGPTNYHAYQPALRKLYEERFSRRMSFPEFQQQEIEIVNDEQTIATWKEQARSTTTYETLQEAEPVTFKSLFEAEQHFRKEYLPKLMKSGVTLETSGPASRATGDRTIGSALRAAWEQEKQFPQNLVNQLRPAFHEANLHYFKHRKRMLYVSPIRPQRAPKGQAMSDGIMTLLATIEATPRCTRHDLAVKILGEQHDTPEAAARKAAMAADLHYLVQQGHVIEFHDGTLDLPLAPGEKGDSEKQEKKPASAAQAQPTEAAAPGMETAVPAMETAAPVETATPAAETSTPAVEADTPAAESATPAMETAAAAVEADAAPAASAEAPASAAPDQEPAPAHEAPHASAPAAPEDAPTATPPADFPEAPIE